MKVSDLVGYRAIVPRDIAILFNDTLQESIQQKFVDHINSHKYFLNQEYKFEIDITKAFGSWLEYVYCPTVDLLVRQGMIFDYDDPMIGYLFFDIQNVWNTLKSRFPKEEKIITIKNAVDYFYVEMYPGGLIRQFFKRIKLKLLGII